MNKKILIIAPSSLPINNAEAIVNAKLLKLLGDNGFIIDLIAKKNKWENYPSNSTLDSLNIKLNKLEIIEVDNRINIKTLYQHLLTFITFGTVFKGAHWAFKVLSQLKGFFKVNEYDYILTKDSPGLLIGYYLKKKFGYKWVATWNDPYPKEKYPFPYGNGTEATLPFYSRKLIHIMEQADFHIFPSARLKSYMRKYVEIEEGHSMVIPHIAFKYQNTKVNSSDILSLLHSGNVQSPRNPKPLILALKRFLEEFPDAKIRVDFVGVYDTDLSEFIHDNAMEGHVFLLPPLNYQEMLDSLQKYKVALIIEANCDEGVFLPTKVGDYMQSQLPIFSISPAIGVLNDLYKIDGVQYFADIAREDTILQAIRTIYTDFMKGELKESYFINDFAAESVLEKYIGLAI